MAGGLLQIVAKGAQDVYLTGNPQITLFKAVYRRHTNFAQECIQQTFNESVTKNATALTSVIAKNADLLSNMHLKVTLPADTIASATSYVAWCNNTGHAFIKDVEFILGSNSIDKQDSVWLDIFNELTDETGNENPLINKHTAKTAYLRSMGGGTLTALAAQKLYIPLKFWFCRNPGLAVPLCALQYQDVKIKINTRGISSLINSDGTITNSSDGTPTVKLFADFIYLDTEERRRFRTIKHEYLIEQVQRQSSTLTTGATNTINLIFNNPVKCIYWVLRDSTSSTAATSYSASIDATANLEIAAMSNNNDYFNYMTTANTNSEVINGVTAYEPFSTGNILFNSSDRFSTQDASYFRTLQPFQAGYKIPEKHIYMYSFALKPNEFQPSGTCNFSRIDHPKLQLLSVAGASNPVAEIYALTYNVLRIAGGQGGLGYAA